jgi:glycosyltransferase involved in cell wall biosynthesis
MIACNEAANLARALRSLACADEIVLVDSGSTDQTPAIAASLGARVIHQPWQGYAAQKNLAVGQAQHDWILSLDADEELDAVAQAAIRSWKGSEPAALTTSAAGFFIPAGIRITRSAFSTGARPGGAESTFMSP